MFGINSLLVDTTLMIDLYSIMNYSEYGSEYFCTEIFFRKMIGGKSFFFKYIYLVGF